MADSYLTLVSASAMLPPNKALESGIVELVSKQNSLLQVLPIGFSNNPTSYSYTREKYIADAYFRTINDTVDKSHSEWEEAQEPMFPLSASIPIDTVFKKGSENQIIETQIGGAIKGITSKMVTSFFDGDNSDSNEPDGLNIRLSSLGQETDVGTNVLADATAAKNYLDTLQDAVAEVDEPMTETGRKLWVMSIKNKIVLNRAIQLSGYYLTTEKDVATGMSTFADIPIVIVDRDKDGNEILGFDEGAGSDESSVYLLNFSKDDGVHLCTPSDTNGNIDPEMYDEGVRGGLHYYFFQLIVGYAMRKKRAGFRIKGIKKA